jgi:hypothetical protein
MHTEEQAKKKWCPMVRPGAYDGTVIDNRHTQKNGEVIWDFSCCIASDCMMWRWTEEDRIVDIGGKEGFKGVRQQLGYCGLAGTPV